MRIGTAVTTRAIRKCLPGARKLGLSKDLWRSSHSLILKKVSVTQSFLNDQAKNVGLSFPRNWNKNWSYVAFYGLIMH